MKVNSKGWGGWVHFEDTHRRSEAAHKLRIVRCKYCSKEMVMNAVRCRHHLLSCKSVPPSVKQSMQPEGEAGTSCGDSSAGHEPGHGSALYGSMFAPLPGSGAAAEHRQGVDALASPSCYQETQASQESRYSSCLGLNYDQRTCLTLPRTDKRGPDSSRMTSQARQNYHADCEAAINRQINLELYSSYVYMSMATFFGRDDIALPGFHKYFKKASDEEREHAEKFIKYQNMRGGRVSFQDVQKPPRDEWGTPLEAMEEALTLEKKVNASLLELHRISNDRSDPQLCDFIENEYLQEQVTAIKEISDHITNLKRVGPGLGEYMYDRETMNDD